MKILSRKQRIRARRLAWRRAVASNRTGWAMIWHSPECGGDHFSQALGRLKPATRERIRLGVLKYGGAKAIVTHKLTAFIPDGEYFK